MQRLYTMYELLKNKLIVILGPTATGKSDLALKIAKKYGTEIVSADSRQFYRGMTIGTAKPSERMLGEVPHHFINSLSVSEDYNIGKYELDSEETLKSIFSRNKVAVLVGGSGLYIHAALEGMDPMPESDAVLRSELRERAKNEGLEGLKEQLKHLDPVYYGEVDLMNPDRVLRALEVCLVSGKPYSSFRVKGNKTKDFDAIKIGLSIAREELYQRINERVDEMMKNGLEDEVRSLLPYRNCNSLRTVGYTELFRYLDGKLSLEEAVSLIKQNSRHYAKRQLTWFRRDPEIKWLPFDDGEKVLEFVEEL